MYNVIFVDTWTSVVPNIWVCEENKECLWPPKNVNVTKAIVKKVSSANDWKVMKYKKLLGPYGKKKNRHETA